MKLKKINIIAAFFLCFNFVYANINTLFNINLRDLPVFSIYNRAPTNLSTNNTNNITPAKRKHELFIEQTASGGYNPIKFNAETNVENVGICHFLRNFV